MTVKVLLFAAARELVGKEEIEIELDEPATIDQLRGALQRRYPQLNDLLSASNWAVNQTYVGPGHPLENGCQVGLIPPVSGG